MDGLRTLPLNKQIYQELLDRIQRQQLNPGDVLPTEKELQEHYGVSRVPVRQALARLEAEGYIQRTPGRGTVITQRSAFPKVRLSGFAHVYNQLGERMTSRTLAVETVPADEEVAGHLGLHPGAPVMRVRRIRTVDGEVTACMNNFFAGPAFGQDLPDSGSEYFTLQQFIRENLNREEMEVQEDLIAAAAPAEVASLMQIPPGTPVLFVTRRGWDERRKPVEFSRYWARTDRMSYRTFRSTKQLEG